MLVLLLFLCSVQSYAAESGDAQAIAESVYNAVAPQAQEALAALGLDSFSVSSIMQLSPRTVIRALLDLLRGSLSAPLNVGVLLLGITLLMKTAAMFFSDDSKIYRVLQLFLVLSVAGLLSDSLTKVFEVAFSAIAVCADFLRIYIPAFAGLLAMSGKPLTSAAYTSVVVGAANLYTTIGEIYFVPAIGIYLFLNVFSALQDTFSIVPMINWMKKCIYIVLTIASVLFTGLLTVKGTLAAGSDTLALKGAKLFVGSAVPIVGGALRDGLSSVLASASLIKSTVGIFGIVVICLTVLPAVIETLLWSFSVQFSAAAAEGLGEKRLAQLLRGIADVLTVVFAFLIFTAFIWVVSTGVILQCKGS